MREREACDKSSERVQERKEVHLFQASVGETQAHRLRVCFRIM